MTDMKHCRKCGCDKPADREHWYFTKIGAMRRPCRRCIIDRKMAYDKENKSSVQAYQKGYRAKNEAARKQYHKNYHANNKDKARAKDARRFANPKNRLDNAIRSGVTKGLRKRGSVKRSRKHLILGWTIDELIAHLEILFEKGMSLDNFGKWHVDHVVPLRRIPYSDENDPLFKQAWSLSNLAPLWAADNQSKYSGLEWQLPDHYENKHLRQMYDNPDQTLLGAIGK